MSSQDKPDSQTLQKQQCFSLFFSLCLLKVLSLLLNKQTDLIAVDFVVLNVSLVCVFFSSLAGQK